MLHTQKKLKSEPGRIYPESTNFLNCSIIMLLRIMTCEYVTMHQCCIILSYEPLFKETDVAYYIWTG